MSKNKKDNICAECGLEIEGFMVGGFLGDWQGFENLSKPGEVFHDDCWKGRKLVRLVAAHNGKWTEAQVEQLHKARTRQDLSNETIRAALTPAL